MKAVTIRNSVSGVLAYARDVDATQSVNMEDVSISDIATYGIRLEGVALNATRLTVSNTFSQGVYTDHQVQINGGEFSEIDSSCLEQTGEYPLTLTGVTMNECASYAVYGRGDIRVIGSHIENVGRGVYSTYGDVTFDTSTLKGSGYYGLYVANSEKILTVSEATVEDIGTNCVDSRGSLSIRDSAVAHCEGWGVYATYDVAVDGLNVSDVTGSGVGAYYGDMTVKSADISLIGKAGIYLYNGDLQLDGMTGSVIGSDGVYVKGSAFIDNLTLSDVNSDGLDVRGGQLELSASAFQNVGRYFVAADKVSAKITDSSFENAGSMGIRAGSLELTTSTVTGATTGVRVETDSDSKIDHCIISDNSSYGVFGGQTTGMSLDVTDSNIMRNGDQGVRYAREVNGNYIAENNGESGVDDTSSGSLDGVYDTTSLQIDGVDAVMNPADAELSGRGAPP